MAYNARADRAKIFAPFDALKGLQEALVAQETITVDRAQLSDEMQEELDYKLRHIDGNPVLTIIYYSVSDRQYLQITGKVTKISYEEQMLQIVGTRISFHDIKEIRGDFFTLSS